MALGFQSNSESKISIHFLKRGELWGASGHNHSLTGPNAWPVGAQQKRMELQRQATFAVLSLILLMELDYLLNVLKPVPDVPVLAAQLLILLDLERSTLPILSVPCTRLTGSGFKTEWEARQGNRAQLYSRLERTLEKRRSLCSV